AFSARFSFSVLVAFFFVSFFWFWPLAMVDSVGWVGTWQRCGLAAAPRDARGERCSDAAHHAGRRFRRNGVSGARSRGSRRVDVHRGEGAMARRSAIRRLFASPP